MTTGLLPAMVAPAVKLAQQGMSYRRIGQALNVDESRVRRTPEVREARIAANPDAHSVTMKTDTIACRVQPATELISRVEWTLASLLGSDYSLSAPDLRRLKGILAGAIEWIDR